MGYSAWITFFKVGVNNPVGTMKCSDFQGHSGKENTFSKYCEVKSRIMVMNIRNAKDQLLSTSILKNL